MATPMSVRPSAAERELWQEQATAAGLSLSNWIRRSCNEAAALERAVNRADEAATRKAERLARMDPVEARELVRYADVDWGPEEAT